jgi:hypothetical protein
MSWPRSFIVVGIAGLAMIGGTTSLRADEAAVDSTEGQANAASGSDLDACTDAETGAGAESADALREQVHSLLKRPLRTLAQAPYKETRQLVDLYTRLESDESLASGERLRLRNLVRTRLAQVRGAIARGLRRQRADAQRSARREEPRGSVETASTATEQTTETAATSEQPSGDSKKAGASEPRPMGGNPQNDAKELIELIEDTIAPESWEIRGGRGVIRYWSNGQALVIRQTGEVHEQIGGFLRRP